MAWRCDSERADIDAVAPFSLGCIKAGVGGPEDFGERDFVLEYGAADAHRQAGARLDAGNIGQVDGCTDAFGDSRSDADVGIAQQDAEFLATNAPDRIAAAHDGTQFLGDELDRFVAGIVSVGVVDRLEMVGIDDEQGGAASVLDASVEKARRPRGGTRSG